MYTTSCTLLRVSTSHPLSFKPFEQTRIDILLVNKNPLLLIYSIFKRTTSVEFNLSDHRSFSSNNSSRKFPQVIYPNNYQEKKHSRNNPSFDRRKKIQNRVTPPPFSSSLTFVTFVPFEPHSSSFHRISTLFSTSDFAPYNTRRRDAQQSFENLWRGPPPPIPQRKGGGRDSRFL